MLMRMHEQSAQRVSPALWLMLVMLSCSLKTFDHTTLCFNNVRWHQCGS